MKKLLPVLGLLGLAAAVLLVVYLPRFKTEAETDLLDDDAVIAQFAGQLEQAVRSDSAAWLAQITQGPADQDPLGLSGGLSGSQSADSEARRQRRIQGWTYWSSLYRQFGHFDWLRQYRDEAGPHLIYRAFDGEKPVYTDLLLGQEENELVLLDWTEHPGSLSEQERAAAFQELAEQIGPDALRQTVEVLVDAVRMAEAGRSDQALQTIYSLPQEWRSNALVVGDELRIMADIGDPAFPSAVLNKGGLLPAPAIAHLAFSWSLHAGDTEGLLRATEDLRNQFGPDSLLFLFEGLAAQWAGDCATAEMRFETLVQQYPQNPVLPAYSLSCLAERDPAAALERLTAILPGTGFTLDELDTWLALEIPALHRSAVYHDWRLQAPQVF